jgi:Protein of unknown function (DUF3019)
MRTLIISMLLAAAPMRAFAQSDSTTPTVELEVKPVLCVIDERMPLCEIEFLVTWRSDRPGYYCLFNDLAATALRCWDEERTGEMIEPRSVAEDFSYWMTDAEDERLATATVEVLRVEEGDRRRRRRSRHIWDLL